MFMTSVYKTFFFFAGSEQEGSGIAGIQNCLPLLHLLTLNTMLFSLPPNLPMHHSCTYLHSVKVTSTSHRRNRFVFVFQPWLVLYPDFVVLYVVYN